LAPWDGSTSTLQLPNRAQRQINFCPNPIGSEVMHEKPHINGTSSPIRPLSGVQLSGPCRRPATRHCLCTNPYRYRATATARNSARKLIRSIVPQFQGHALFGERVIRFRCDCRALLYTAGVCSAPLRGRSTNRHVFGILIDELVQYRNCNRSARPTGQYPEALASTFTIFTPVRSDWNVAVAH
jgi:hypothetical protein